LSDIGFVTWFLIGIGYIFFWCFLWSVADWWSINFLHKSRSGYKSVQAHYCPIFMLWNFRKVSYIDYYFNSGFTIWNM